MRRGLVLVGTLLIVVATAVAAHDALAYAAIRATAGLLGYGVRAASFTVGFKSLSVRDLSVVNSAGEPVFALQRGYIAYSLRDLLPGGRRRFGLQAVDLGAPTLTLIHHADGSYNVPVPNLSNPNAQPNEPPIDMRIRIRNGTVVLLDEYIVPHHERRERIEGLHFDAVFSPSRHSYYNSGFALNDGGRSYPVFGRAVFSTARGFSSQHWYAKQLPIGPLFDFALSSHALNLADGTLVGLDARLYTIVSPAGVSTGLISASAQLKDGKLYAAQLAKPVRDAHGPMHLFNDGIETTGLTATLAGVPLHLVGGIYNPTAPNVRFYLTGDGDLARLRQIAAQAQRQDVRGRLLFSLFIEGSLQQPLVFARFRAPVMDYERFPLNGLRGLVAFSGTRLDVLSSGVSYGPLFLSARGSVKLERRVAATLVGDVRGETRSLPYAAQLIPAEHFDGTAVVRGVDRQLGSSGILLASGPGGHLSAPFSVDENGTGAIGPVALVRSDGGSMAGDVLLDRPDDAVLASLDASQLRIGSAPSAPLPGVLLAPLPPIDGTLDAHATALVRAANLVTAHMHLDLNQDHRVVADLQGNASAQGETAAVTGRLQASLGALARAVGSGAASGAVDARFSALRRGATTVVQVADAQFSHARLDGVPIQQARATLGLRNGVVDVYGASFQAAGGSATLLGRFGDGGKLYVTAHGIDLAALSSLGLPLQRGRFYALARIGGSPQAPTAHLRALLAQGTYDDLPLDANAEVGYAGDRVDIEDASALLAGAYATANGEVRGVRMGHLAPRVALAAHARALDVASLAKAMKAHLPYPADGSVDADIRVDGPARAPEVAGTIGVPEGSVNGLFFHDGAAHIRGSLGAMTVREGRVTVGSTRIAFGGHVDPAAQSITLNAPHVDLADFDDFFDPGDMLAGRGSVALDASHAGPALRVSGGAFVAGTRFRRFELGDLRFRARPAPGAQEAELDVNGAHGSLQSTARIALSGADDVSGSARLSNLDLGTWLPAAGITLPVFGDVDAVAQMRGTLHAPVLALQASLANGRVGHVTVNTLTLDGSVDRQHVHLTQAVLELPSLSATVSGTTGLTPAAPFALALRASSPNIGALATTLAGKTVDTAGALAATAQVSGTQSRPHVTAQATLQNLRVRNLVVPRIVASAGLSPTMLTVDRGEIDLTKGVAQLTAHVPVNLAAHRLAGSDAPVRASLSASQIDLAQFAPAFAEDTKLGGQMDGSLSVGGNLGNPSLGGHLALTNGSYSSSLLTSALTRMTLALDLSGTTMRLSQLHLEAGGGSLDGNGVASVTDLRHSLQTLSLQASAVAKHLRLDAPKYFQGTIDGTVAVTKTPQTTPLVAGSLAFSATRIPLTALLPPSARASSAPSPLPVAFHLAVTAGNDVRVQSANVDIGARGNVLLAGTLASPVLSGRFVSTGGSISFYRTFTLQHGVVAFSPDSGIIPYVDATATTSISDPPTNILLHASGPATHLNVDFASDPSYSRDQIVGLLANLQSVGAVSGVSTVASTGQPSLLTSAAEGYVNDQFTRMLLEPLQSNLGQSLGLQNLQLQAGLGGGYGANATAALGKNLTASFGETYGPTQRQTIGLTQRFSSASSLELALFSATGAAELPVATGYVDDPTQPTDLALLTLIPPAGTKGFTLSYQHHF